MKSQNKSLIQYNDFHLNFSHLKNDIMQMSQKEFADFLGIATGAVGGYENRTRTPNAKALITICEKCNISADYLLGLSDITKPDSALKFVCEYTGLSEKAVENLNKYNKNNEYSSLSKLIEEIGEKDYGGFVENLHASILDEIQKFFEIGTMHCYLDLSDSNTPIFYDYRNTPDNESFKISNQYLRVDRLSEQYYLKRITEILYDLKYKEEQNEDYSFELYDLFLKELKQKKEKAKGDDKV